jgi:hypothetical protein
VRGAICSQAVAAKDAKYAKKKHSVFSNGAFADAVENPASFLRKTRGASRIQTEASSGLLAYWSWQLLADTKVIYTRAVGRTKSRACGSKGRIGPDHNSRRYTEAEFQD